MLFDRYLIVLDALPLRTTPSVSECDLAPGVHSVGPEFSVDQKLVIRFLEILHLGLPLHLIAPQRRLFLCLLPQKLDHPSESAITSFIPKATINAENHFKRESSHSVMVL